MGHRRRAREFALQMLFQLDVTGATPPEIFRHFWTDQHVDDATRAFSERLVSGVHEQREQTDRMIARCAEHWRIERMAVVDRNVLRIALYEMLHDPRTPPAVAIDEAIEVAKKFGGAESGAFINGVLDALRKGLEQGTLDGPELREPEAGA